MSTFQIRNKNLNALFVIFYVLFFIFMFSFCFVCFCIYFYYFILFFFFLFILSIIVKKLYIYLYNINYCFLHYLFVFFLYVPLYLISYIVPVKLKFTLWEYWIQCWANFTEYVRVMTNFVNRIHTTLSAEITSEYTLIFL